MDNKLKVAAYIFLGLAGALLVMAILALGRQRPSRVRVNDGRSVQVEDGVVYNTYIEELDETK